MLFRKRNKNREGLGPQKLADNRVERPKFHKIEFDMMTKGAILRRGRHEIRQFGVTVNGATCLVTSGDVVDHEIYKALLSVDALALPTEHDDKKPEESSQS